MTSLFIAGSLVVSTLLTTGVQALARTNATCVSEFWSFNSYQQSPCLVAAYLGTPCSTTGDWAVIALDTAGDYYVLNERIASPCQCNTVQWSLLAACSMCQTGAAGSWTAWTANCPAANINIGKYPLPIPAGTAVPHWAYYDFTNTGVFNVAIASQQLGPESTVEAATTATSSATPKPPQPTTTPQSEPSNNIGAIVGGAVGGVLGLALIGLVAFAVVRKGKGRTEPASHNPQGGYNPSVGTHPGSAAPMMAQSRSQPQLQPRHPGMVSAPSAGLGSAYKQHDSGDLSTFQSGTNISSPPTPYTDSLPYSNSPQHQARPGNYTGAPQV